MTLFDLAAIATVVTVSLYLFLPRKKGRYLR